MPTTVVVPLDGSADAKRALRPAAEVADPVICLATHARQGFGGALFGSVAEATLGLVDVPALLVGPDVHALSTHRRTGLARLRAGSVTVETVRLAPCPVLTVRANGLKDRIPS